MFGGMGGGGPTLQKVRVGALAVFVVLGLALHRNGSAYNALHTVYFVVIGAVIVASIAAGRKHTGLRAARRCPPRERQLWVEPTPGPDAHG